MYTLEFVSVIMPVYNAQEFIAKSIESVLMQTYVDLELILIDDGSTDQSKKIIKEFMQKDSRIRYIELEKNMGVANARNIGIEESKGEYIAFLDSDDLWDNTKLEKQIKFMKDKNCAMSYTSCRVIDKNGKKVKNDRIVPTKITYKELLKGNAIPCLTVILHRKHLQIQDMKMPVIHHEDYATWLNILKTGIVAYGIEEVLASYRYTGDSISSNKKKAVLWTWKILYKNQQLGFLKSIYYFGHYVIKAFLKYK